jgi:hypothetical protein
MKIRLPKLAQIQYRFALTFALLSVSCADAGEAELSDESHEPTDEYLSSLSAQKVPAAAIAKVAVGTATTISYFEPEQGTVVEVEKGRISDIGSAPGADLSFHQEQTLAFRHGFSC